MAKTLSQTAKAQYLKNPRHCPFCGSNSLTSGDDFTGEGDFGDPGKIYVFMQCDDCLEYWNDVYKLVGIETQEELEIEANG